MFHFHKERNRDTPPDTLTPGLTIDDKVLKQIFRRLYYPESPYEFAVFPAEILGHVYERFLGSVIRLTSGGRARIEQKPEVRKAGGVYYTPTYIVDYIVKHTVGKLVEGKTPQEVAGVTNAWRPSKTRRPLAVLDPACGSGSFLLGAYQFLLDWHLEQYLEEPEKWAKGKAPKIYEHHRHGWRLITAERKRILLTNIYGVDIDPQAVEVTKLSLLLKVLEGESAEALRKQRLIFHERALPDLGSNIKCGNSLIGPDFYEGRQAELFDEEEQYRINAFDWQAEFPQVFNVAQPPPAVRHVAQPPPAVRHVAQPPSAVGHVAQPPSAVGHVAQPPSAVGHVAQPPPAVKSAKPLKSEYRRNLPHLQAENKTLYVTFSTWKRWQLPESVRDLVLSHCLHDHGTKIWMHGVVVMPDHVHMVFTPLNDEAGRPFGLAEIMSGIKGASAHSVNRALRRKGKLWQDESFDHVLRSAENTREKVEYICQNPIRKGLAGDEEEYPWLWREWIEGEQSQPRAAVPHVISAAGFDAVIGNPPYVRQEGLKELKKYFEGHFEAYSGTADLYVYFIEKALRLLRANGRFAFIVSSSFLRTSFAEPLRRFLGKAAGVLRIVDFGGLPVFASAKDTYVCIPVMGRMKQAERIEITRVDTLEPTLREKQLSTVSYAVPAERLTGGLWSLKSNEESALFEKICASGEPLGDYLQKRMYY